MGWVVAWQTITKLISPASKGGLGLAGSENVRIGDSISPPDKVDGSKAPADVLAQVHSWPGVKIHTSSIFALLSGNEGHKD